MKTYFILLLLFPSLNVRAQSIERQVIGTTGTSYNSGTIMLDQTLGESVILTHDIGSIILTQGFHQPPASGSIGISELETSIFNIFPNPTKDVFTITNESGEEFEISLYSTDGKLILREKAIGLIQFSLGEYAYGSYYIQLLPKSGKRIHSKIIKQ